MATFKLCRTCGVPLRVGKDHVWCPDGTVVQRRDPDHRMILFDSEGIDALFTNIEQLIGLPIEKIVIESKARATAAYISHLLRGFRGTAARVVGLERIVQRVVNQGRVMGYGDITVLGVDWKNMLMRVRIGNPYSLKLFCGDMRGATEAIRNAEAIVSYEETSPGVYLVETRHEPHAPELKDRLMPSALPRKPGDIRYDLCPQCGVPLEAAQFKWDTVAGTIVHEPTGLRYALVGPAGLQAVFDELERELGEDIPAAVIEAQRLHSSKRMSKRWASLGTGELKTWLREWLATQGMGNLVSMESLEGGGFAARIENPAVPLVLLGTSAALFEFLSGSTAALDWSLAEDGDLSLSVSPAG